MQRRRSRGCLRQVRVPDLVVSGGDTSSRRCQMSHPLATARTRAHAGFSPLTHVVLWSSAPFGSREEREGWNETSEKGIRGDVLAAGPRRGCVTPAQNQARSTDRVHGDVTGLEANDPSTGAAAG